MALRRTRSTLALIIVTILAATGCRLRSHEPDTPDYALLGWRALSQQDYRGAIQYFAEGAAGSPEHADFWNGLGWAYGRLGRADTSLADFNEGVALADTTIVGTEILAGRSMTNLAMAQYTQAISDGKAALERGPLWVFRRDPNVSFLHLTLNVATAFCSLGEFDSSLVWVQKLDSHFNADVSTLSGKAQLVAKLEDLENEL